MEALKPDAPQLHPEGNVLSRQTLSRGDVDKAIAEAAFVVTNHYSTPQTDHAFMDQNVPLHIVRETKFICIQVAKMFMMIGVKLLVCLAFQMNL